MSYTPPGVIESILVARSIDLIRKKEQDCKRIVLVMLEVPIHETQWSPSVYCWRTWSDNWQVKGQCRGYGKVKVMRKQRRCEKYKVGKRPPPYLRTTRRVYNSHPAQTKESEKEGGFIESSHKTMFKLYYQEHPLRFSIQAWFPSYVLRRQLWRGHPRYLCCTVQVHVPIH